MVDDSFMNRRVGQLVDARLRDGKNWDFARRLLDRTIKSAVLPALGDSLKNEDLEAFMRELEDLRTQLKYLERSVLGDKLLGKQ